MVGSGQQHEQQEGHEQRPAAAVDRRAAQPAPAYHLARLHSLLRAL